MSKNTRDIATAQQLATLAAGDYRRRRDIATQKTRDYLARLEVAGDDATPADAQLRERIREHLKRRPLDTELGALCVYEAHLIRTLRGWAREILAEARESDDPEHREVGMALRRAALCPGERARCAQLARAFRRGMPYAKLEANHAGEDAIYVYDRLGHEIAKKAEASKAEILDWLRASTSVAQNAAQAA